MKKITQVFLVLCFLAMTKSFAQIIPYDFYLNEVDAIAKELNTEINSTQKMLRTLNVRYFVLNRTGDLEAYTDLFNSKLAQIDFLNKLTLKNAVLASLETSNTQVSQSFSKIKDNTQAISFALIRLKSDFRFLVSYIRLNDKARYAKRFSSINLHLRNLSISNDNILQMKRSLEDTYKPIIVELQAK